MEEGFLGHPEFDVGAADGIGDEADGDAGGGLDAAGEVESGGAEAVGGGRGAGLPLAADVVLRGAGEVVFRAEVADGWEVGAGDVFRCLAGTEGPVHV